MDVAAFHLKLLGKNSQVIPSRYQLTERQQLLYTAFSKWGARGLSSSPTDEELFIGTLVLALSQTSKGTEFQPVALVIPHPKVPWIMGQIKEMARYVFSLRKKDLDAVRALRAAFHQLQLLDRPFKFKNEPPNWVIWGFERSDLLPDWAKNRIS